MRKKRAFLLSFEGIEGTGKSTQIQLLNRFLKKKGFKTCVFREPGSSVIGEEIRKILLHSHAKLTLFSETMLFIAARNQLILEKIEPNILKKDIIILDRYLDATVAYQGFGAGVNLKLINDLNKEAVGIYMPDVTILLDIDPKSGLKRSGRTDRFEKRKLDFHKKVRSGYLRLAKETPRRIKKVSTVRDIGSVQKQIQEFVCRAIKNRKR